MCNLDIQITLGCKTVKVVSNVLMNLIAKWVFELLVFQT